MRADRSGCLWDLLRRLNGNEDAVREHCESLYPRRLEDRPTRRYLKDDPDCEGVDPNQMSLLLLKILPLIWT